MLVQHLFEHKKAHRVTRQRRRVLFNQKSHERLKLCIAAIAQTIRRQARPHQSRVRPGGVGVITGGDCDNGGSTDRKCRTVCVTAISCARHAVDFVESECNVSQPHCPVDGELPLRQRGRMPTGSATASLHCFLHHTTTFFRRMTCPFVCFVSILFLHDCASSNSHKCCTRSAKVPPPSQKKRIRTFIRAD